MESKRINLYVSVSCIIVLLITLTACDLYDPADKQTITMNSDQQDEKPNYLDGKESKDESEVDLEVNQEVIDEVLPLEEADESTLTNEGSKIEADDVIPDGLEEGDESSESVSEDISEEDKQKSRDANAEGYDLYQEGNYEAALLKFKASIQYDGDYFYGHFNYACTLGVLMKEDYPTWYETKSEVIDELKRCLDIDPNSQAKIMKDSDLDLVKSELEYLKEIAGFDITTSEGARQILQQANWYVHGNGVISVLGEIDFNGNNVTFTYMNLEAFNDGIIAEPIRITGTYATEASLITFKMNGPMLKRRSLSDVYNNYDVIDDRVEFSGTLSDDGILTIDGFEYQYYTWYDEFSA